MGKLIKKEVRFYKECRVAMLATNKPSVVGQLVRGVKGKVDVINVVVRSGVQPNESVTFNNLYITSDDEIKDGDWFVNLSTNQVHQAGIYADICHKPEDKHCRKIIATTDTSIWEHDDTVPFPKTRPALPQPSDKFIQAYIDAYNKGEKIEKVLVEYEKGNFRPDGSQGYLEPGAFTFKWLLKLKDNQIIIKKAKDSWTRDEVIGLLNKLYYTDLANVGGNFDKWINENL